MLGVLSPYEALKEAERRGLDLVEISPKAQPPVCKIMDYGKFKYEAKKKAHATRQSKAAQVVKEVTLSPSTDIHDLTFKMKNCQRFLEEGHRVKVGIRFRGREMAHPEIGREQMARCVDFLKEFGAPEMPPKMEGRMLAALFAPLSQLSKSVKPQAAATPQASAPSAPAAPKAPPVQKGPVVEVTTAPLGRGKA